MSTTETELRALFIERSRFRPLEVGAADAATGSRVGGPPPTPLAAAPPSCPACGGKVLYLLTLAADVLGESIAQGRAVSFLTCADLDCRMNSHVIAAPSSLLFVVHDDAPRAAPGSALDNEFEGRSLVRGELRDDEATSDDSTVGGQPGYLQRWGGKEAGKARDRGAEFLFQWSEVSYPNDMKIGPYPFLFGTVYVFAPVDPATQLPELRDLVGFWQNA